MKNDKKSRKDSHVEAKLKKSYISLNFARSQIGYLGPFSVESIINLFFYYNIII